MNSAITLDQVYNHELVQELIDQNQRLAVFAPENLDDVVLPYIVKDTTLMNPGIANQLEFSKKCIQFNFEQAEFSKQNLALFLDHKDGIHVSAIKGILDGMPSDDGGVRTWVGHVDEKSMHVDTEGKLRGNLIIVDKDTAIKLAYGAGFGISPKLRIPEEEIMKGKINNFAFENFSIVLNPAFEKAVINENKEKKSINEEVDTMETVKMSDRKVISLIDKAISFDDNAEGYEYPSTGNIVDLAKAIINGEGDVKENAQAILTIANKLSSEASEETKEEPQEEEKEEETKEEVKEEVAEEEVGEVKEETSEDAGEEKTVENSEEVKEESEEESKEEVTEETEEEGEEKDIKEMKEAESKLSEAYTLLEEKDKVIAKFEKDINDLKKKIVSFESVEKAKEDSVKKAKFNDIVKDYCDFHNIEGKGREAVATRLATLSEDALEMICKDVKTTKVAKLEKEPNVDTKHSSQLSIASTKAKVSPKGTMIDNMFNKLQTINKI